MISDSVKIILVSWIFSQCQNSSETWSGTSLCTTVKSSWNKLFAWKQKEKKKQKAISLAGDSWEKSFIDLTANIPSASAAPLSLVLLIVSLTDDKTPTFLPGTVK